MKRRILIFSVCFVIIFPFAFEKNFAWAQFPERKIRYVVTWAPGGQADMTARALARFANPYLGGKIYVENVPGASGAIGFRECSKSAPDGHTMVLLTSALLTAPYVLKDYPTYDMFDPVCIVNLDSRVIVTKSDGRFKTAAELISYAKAHPGEVTVGTAGVGSVNHIGMASFAEATGIKFTFVPFKADGPSVMAVMGGHVDIVAAGNPTVKSLVEGNKLRSLLILGEKRFPFYPNIPTAKELGYNVVVVALMGVGVPKNTPSKIVNTLAEAFKKAVEGEDYKKFLDQWGLEWFFLGPKEAYQWLKGQDNFYKSVVPKIGLRPE